LCTSKSSYCWPLTGVIYMKSATIAVATSAEYVESSSQRLSYTRWQPVMNDGAYALTLTDLNSRSGTTSPPLTSRQPSMGTSTRIADPFESVELDLEGYDLTALSEQVA
jgi:hypothetical protein